MTDVPLMKSDTIKMSDRGRKNETGRNNGKTGQRSDDSFPPLY